MIEQLLNVNSLHSTSMKNTILSQNNIVGTTALKLCYNYLGEGQSKNCNYKPLCPGVPVGPVEPVSPLGPGRPVEPAGPDIPVKPVGPLCPVEPDGPIAPLFPEEPVAPRINMRDIQN